MKKHTQQRGHTRMQSQLSKSNRIKMEALTDGAFSLNK